MGNDARTTIVRPVFKVVVGGTDVTRRLESHLSSMTLIACREDHADQLELEFEEPPPVFRTKFLAIRTRNPTVSIGPMALLRASPPEPLEELSAKKATRVNLNNFPPIQPLQLDF